MTEKKATLEFVGTLGDIKPRMLAAEEMACAAEAQQLSGIDPCSSAGLD